MNDSEQFDLKWKGRRFGPFSISEIRSMLKEREISLVHEIYFWGEWITLRAFLRRIDTASTTPEPAGDISRQPTPVVPAEPGPLSGSHAKPELDSPGKGAALPSSPQTHLTAALPPPSPSRPTPKEESLRTGIPPSQFREPTRESQPRKSQTKPPATKKLQPASFSTRGIAMLFDALILGIPALLWARLRSWELPDLPKSRPETLGLLEDFFRNNTPAAVFALLLFWLYFTLFESSPLQATPGKRMMGLRVLQRDRGRATFSDASVRFAGKLLSGLPAFWGFFLAAFTPFRQALHDVIAHCYVVCDFPDANRIS